ncbi:MAG: acetyl-CoA C-acetyltransferase, partial [Aquabacterium sp.]|uniref:acetyl-CoA C-acetyltransferase n=1 Tax=Aquabacterium sp. TaxID=1872578 RepID=UPI001DC3BCB4
MNTTVRRVAIIGGNRIPFARSNTVYSNVSNQEMLTATLQGLADRFNLHGKRLGDVAAGAVMKHSRDFNLVRESVLSTTLAPETPAYDLQQACGTGLEAIMLVANKIALGHIECGIGGGVDTTSDAPIGINEKMRKILMEANRAKGTMAQLKVMSQIRPSMLMKPAIPKNGEPRTGFSMGEHAELMAREWGIPREEQDQLAVASHANLARAYKDGFFADLITPFKGVSKDNNLREGLSIEKLRSLKPCFDKKVAPGQGTLTPGNSTPLTDGASAVLLGSEEWARANNLPVLAYITFSEVAAVDFFNKKEGLLMAPAYAVPRMLDRAGIKLQDFDFYEIHEAF